MAFSLLGTGGKCALCCLSTYSEAACILGRAETPGSARQSVKPGPTLSRTHLLGYLQGNYQHLPSFWQGHGSYG